MVINIAISQVSTPTSTQAAAGWPAGGAGGAARLADTPTASTTAPTRYSTVQYSTVQYSTIQYSTQWRFYSLTDLALAHLGGDVVGSAEHGVRPATVRGQHLDTAALVI